MTDVSAKTNKNSTTAYRQLLRLPWVVAVRHRHRVAVGVVGGFALSCFCVGQFGLEVVCLFVCVTLLLLL